MKAFARWRVRVWSRRLKAYQKEWNRVAAADIGPREVNGVTVDQFYERLTTRALLKRTKWRKRAGIRRAQGGPVTKGRPYIRGEARPELFVPTEPGKKLSPPAGKPEPRLPDPFRPPERDRRNGL